MRRESGRFLFERPAGRPSRSPPARARLRAPRGIRRPERSRSASQVRASGPCRRSAAHQDVSSSRRHPSFSVTARAWSSNAATPLDCGRRRRRRARGRGYPAKFYSIPWMPAISPDGSRIAFFRPEAGRTATSGSCRPTAATRGGSRRTSAKAAGRLGRRTDAASCSRRARRQPDALAIRPAAASPSP